LTAAISCVLPFVMVTEETASMVLPETIWLVV
jgi:hypothetical protein